VDVNDFRDFGPFLILAVKDSRIVGGEGNVGVALKIGNNQFVYAGVSMLDLAKYYAKGGAKGGAGDNAVNCLGTLQIRLIFLCVYGVRSIQLGGYIRGNL
jgi:hypothetical protein